MLNKQKGNMYKFVTHTWNVIKGKCQHDCIYCYMKRFPQKDLWFDRKELKTDLGNNNFIFVGSSTDMFADNIQGDWIIEVLDKCRKSNDKYLFQTKNPKRLRYFLDLMPDDCIFGVTLETNRENNLTEAPPRIQRFSEMILFTGRKMISIEPIMDFDLDILLRWIKEINPIFVSIGADSNKKKDYSFPEPSSDKIKQLIKELGKNQISVITKENLKRLI